MNSELVAVSAFACFFLLLPPVTLPCESPADNDLRGVEIPDEALEVPRPWRSIGNVNHFYEYRHERRKVGERLFYENGQTAEERLFVDEKPHGIWRQFYEDGTLFSERPFRDGVLDGTCRFFDSQGALLGESTIKKGTGTLREYRKRDLKCSDSKIPLVNGKVHGMKLTWGRHEGARGVALIAEGYKDGVHEGWTFVWGEDGELVFRAFGKHGQPHGEMQMKGRDGQPAKGFPRYFVDGKRVERDEFLHAAKADKLLAESLTTPSPKRSDYEQGHVPPPKSEEDRLFEAMEMDESKQGTSK